MRIKFDGTSDISVCYPNGMLDTKHSNKKVKKDYPLRLRNYIYRV